VINTIAFGARSLEPDSRGGCPTGYSFTHVPSGYRMPPVPTCVLNPGAAPANLSYPATRTERCAPGGGYRKSCIRDECFCVTGAGHHPVSWAEHEARVAAATHQAPASCPTNCWWDDKSQRCECAAYGAPSVTTSAPPSASPLTVETPSQPLQPAGNRSIPWGWIAFGALGVGAFVLFLR